MQFPCTKCGCCCKIVALIPQLMHLKGLDGVCIHYSEEIGCTIYDDRPLICNFEKVHLDVAPDVTQEQFYAVTALACNVLIHIAGKQDKLINLEQFNV